MAEVVADRLLGGSATFPGADLSTKLKLLGVDVASFGDAFGAAAGWLPRTGIAGAFTLTAAVALLAAVLARRIPSRTIPAPSAADAG